LRGYVELAYDLNNAPVYRLIEPLLYHSPYYDESAQSVMLSITNGDDRPFVLSTPRLEAENTLHVQIPFRDERLDSLFKWKRTPTTWEKIRGTFDLDESAHTLLRTLFTDQPPRRYQRYTGQGIRWRYFGHACILIETDSVNILIDPVLSYTYESKISRYTYADLPDSIDYVLITHNHQDHILLETLLQLRHKVRQIVVPRNAFGMLQDPSLKQMFTKIGFPRVIELSEFEQLELENGFVMGLPFFGEHADLAIGTKLAHFVRLGRYGLLFAADSCNVEPRLYKHVHDVVGDMDVLFIGMECDGAPLTWLYGPLMSRRIERGMDESRRLNGSNCDQAIEIVNEFNCKEVYVYAMGQEPWLNFVMSLKYTAESRPIVESDRLVMECQRRGITAERLFGEKEILIQQSIAV
jgi:L-ascorbate metabolism protein UlaG (beta-lactamase superfamily)